MTALRPKPGRGSTYGNTVERMEPDIGFIDETAGWSSAAISLRRIADEMEGSTAIDRLRAALQEALAGGQPEKIRESVQDLLPPGS